VNDAFASRSSAAEAEEYVVSQLRVMGSCKTTFPENFTGLRRDSVEQLPLHNPLGQTWLLLGIPKIGKSSILTQLQSAWQGLDVRLFDIPPDADAAVAREIAFELLHSLVPGQDAERLVTLSSARQEALPRAGISSTPTPLVIAVDGSENIPDAGLRLLSAVLCDVKHAGIGGWSCVFVSNKPLPSLTVIDETIAAPKWTGGELKQLLAAEGVASPNDAYLDLLVVISGGHPLIALALARRSPTRRDLVRRRLIAHEDDPLSIEMTHFLFDELLADPDLRTFACRLSLLVTRHKRPVLDAIRNVEPVVSTPTPVAIGKLEKVLVEGNPDIGY
jgi:hypothetical protein